MGSPADSRSLIRSAGQGPVGVTALEQFYRLYFSAAVAVTPSFANIAQSVEQLICNQSVVGSIPSVGIYATSNQNKTSD